MEPEYPAESTEQMSLIDRLTGVFVSPGEVFENVRQAGLTHANWLIPCVIYIIVSVASGQLILSNPSLHDQFRRSIREQYDKSTEQAIVKGQLTQEQADQQFEQFASPDSPWFTMFTVGGALLRSFGGLFLLSLICLLLGKSITSTPVPYMKVVEVIGLTLLIDSLESLVTTALVFAADSIQASPSPAIFLPTIDPESKTDILLAKLNLFTFWDIGVISIGLAKLFQKDFRKVLVLVFALWALWTAFSLFSGFNLAG